MALHVSGTPIANVLLTDTFNTWRIRTNQALADGVSATSNTTITAPIVDFQSVVNIATLNANSVLATDLRGTLDVLSSSQPNITSLGALDTLTVTGNTAGNRAAFTGPVLAPYVGANTVSATSVAGTLTTSAQPNITEVGTLTSITTTGLLDGKNATFTGPVTAPVVTANSVTGSTVTSTGAVVGASLDINGAADIASSLVVHGDLTVNGNTITISTETLSVDDNLIYLNANSVVSNPDLGIAGNYNDGSYAHAGLFRDASDQGTWKFFEEYTPEPDANTEINTAHPSFQLANVSMRWVKPTEGISTAQGVFTGPITAPTMTANSVTINGDALLVGSTTFNNYIKEEITVAATATSGTVDYDVTTQTVLYNTANAAGNWTLNVRGDAGTTLNSIMSTGQALSLTFLVTNGATPYYQTLFQIDGSTTTPLWSGGSAPSGGNASSVDSYGITIVKTADATFSAFASQTQFANA